MRCINFRRYYPMSDNYDHIEEMHKAAEATGGICTGKEASNVRRVVSEVLTRLDIRNKIDNVRLDNIFWQINFGSPMSGEERKEVQALTAEALGIKPECIKLVAVYPH